jgi:hypothetical protein
MATLGSSSARATALPSYGEAGQNYIKANFNLSYEREVFSCGHTHVGGVLRPDPVVSALSR